MQNSDSKIRVYLVDDQAMIRAAFRSFLEQLDRFEVVGDAGDVRVALEEVRERRPDVVVLDITMPGLSGLDGIPLIRKDLPRAKIVMLTHHEGETFVEQRAADSEPTGICRRTPIPAEIAHRHPSRVQRGDSLPHTQASSRPLIVTRGSCARVSRTSRRRRIGFV